MERIDELIDKLAHEAVAVKPAPHPYVLSLKWMAAAALYLVISLAVFGLRPDIMEKFHEMWFVAEIVALFLVFIATSVSAALLAYPDLYQKRLQAFAPAVAFLLFLLVILFAWNADNPPAPLPIHSFECTLSIFMFSLLPAVWTFYSMRKFASTNYYWAGSVALLSAFSVGALWLRLFEVNDSILHLVEWHYLPMIAAGMLGLWLGKVLLRW